jgi:hypothetical protein
MEPPETRYAKSGDVHIAYQVVGDGPLDLIFVPGFVSNVEMVWESPGWARFFSRLAAFSRLILFDKRGTGLSDRHVGVAYLEERMDDVRAVMDDVRAGNGCRRLRARRAVRRLGRRRHEHAVCRHLSRPHPALTLYGSYARHPTDARRSAASHRTDSSRCGAPANISCGT